MPTSIVISEIPPFDGEYEFDDRMFSTFELRWIKQIAGYLPLNIDDGLKGGDADLFCALAVIAMNRAGKVAKEDVLEAADVLAEAPFDGSRIRIVGEEVDENPPALTSEPDAPSLSDSLDSSKSSGPDLASVSDRSDSTPEPTGTLKLHTSPMSVPTT